MDSIKLVTLTWKWKIGVWKMIAIHMSNNSSKYFRKIRSWNFLLSQGVSNRKEHRDWCQKFATDTFAHKSKSLNDRVKSQARSQNYWSTALKWGIEHFCTSYTFWDTAKCIKIWDFQFLRFCKKMAKSLYKIAKKCENSKIGIFCF